MKDFSKGLNGISADMLKSVAQISAESRQKAAEQAQQHKQGLAGRFESFRPVPADQIEKTPRAIERVYAGMAPAYKSEQKEETIAERVAALKVTTKHQTIPHDSVLLEPKITLKGGAKRKMEAEGVELTDEDKAFIEQLNTEGKAHTIPKTEKEKSLAKLAHPKDKITHKDVMVGRGVIAKEEAEQPVEEGWDDMLKSVKEKGKPQPNGGSGVKQGTRYGGGKQKDTEEKKEKSEANEEVEIVYEANIQPTSGNSRSHISNLSNPTVNSVTHKQKQIGLITKQSDGTFYAHHSAAKVAHAKGATFDTKDKAHQFIRNAHADAIKKGTLSDKFMKTNEEVEQIDELSPATLGSYVKKATSDVRMNTNMARNTTGKQSDKFTAKAWKREDNVGKAVDRMTKEEVEQIDEISPELAASYLKGRSTHKPDLDTPETNKYSAKIAQGKAGAAARMYGYGRDKNAENKVTGRFEYRKKVGTTQVFSKEEAEQIEEKKLRDTPGQEHICAVHVKHSKLGEGKTLFSQHAEPDANGNIAWYDVMFAEGIERVETKDLEIVVSESHMNHKKK